MLELAERPAAGLFTATGEAPVPLIGVQVDAEINGLCARVTVAHRYANRERVPIEAIYVFPLDENAAVCGFEAVIDGTRVVGQVLEREKAFVRYDEAMERGDGAFLLDEERPDVFQASIGNLAPGTEVLVRLTYVTELPVDDGQLRFTVPTTIVPRYAPERDRTGVGRSDAEALNPPVAWQVPYGLALSVRLSMPGGISGLASSSHPVAIALSDGQAIVTLSAQEAALDRDFVLTADASTLRTPQAWVEDDNGAKTVAVAFAPSMVTVPGPADVVFVVDRSGSMMGDSIAQVRNALQLCLRSLTPGCRFDIVGFGTTYGSLFHGSRPYDQSSLDAARAHVETMEADLGGTEIEPALRAVLERPAIDGLPRQVVVLTDGGVTNTDAVLALVGTHRDRARVFAFGIGASASQHLVRGIARKGGGTAEFIHPGERIETKVLRVFGRLLAPALTEVRVDWTGGQVSAARRSEPPVFAGQRLLTYATVAPGAAMPASVRLSATTAEETMTWDVPVPEAATSGTVVATLAARARIRELEEGDEWLEGRGSRQRERRTRAARQQIIDLAVRHGLMSRETSYVAVEQRETPLIGSVQLRRVPIALASGWGGLQAPGLLQAPGSSTFACMPAISRADIMSFGDAAPRLAEPRAVLRSATFRPSMVARWFASLSSPRRPAQLDALVALQAADGSWPLDAALATALGARLAELEQARPAEAGGAAHGARVWSTALAMAWLEQHAAAWQDEWRLLADKARDWLESAVPGESAAVIAAARRVI